MTQLQKIILGASLVCAIGTVIYEHRQASRLQQENLVFQQRQASLRQQAQRLACERDEIAGRIALLRDENERLNRNTPELLKLRSELGRLRDGLQAAEGGGSADPTFTAAQAWLNRIKLLKQHFEQWPGKPTPELQLLSEQNWAAEAAAHQLDSEKDFRASMGRLRMEAKSKFAVDVNKAIEEFAIINNELPTDISQLASYLKPPLDTYLQNYEIARPGLIDPPQPNSPNSERAKTWALVDKGSFSPDGAQNGLYPEFDGYIVIYRGGWYSVGDLIVSDVK